MQGGKKKNQKKKANGIRTPEISATLWMGTSFLLCSPLPFLMALQVKERSWDEQRSPAAGGWNGPGAGLKQTHRPEPLRLREKDQNLLQLIFHQCFPPPSEQVIYRPGMD